MKRLNKRVLEFIFLFFLLIFLIIFSLIKPKEYPKIYLDETISNVGKFIEFLMSFFKKHKLINVKL